MRIIIHEPTVNTEEKLSAVKFALRNDEAIAAGQWIGVRIAGKYFSLKRNLDSITVRDAS